MFHGASKFSTYSIACGLSPDLPMYTPPTVNSFPAHSMEIRRSYSAYYRVQKEMDDECRPSQFLYNGGNYNNFEPKVTI
jgi:hypothetical protein